MDQQQANRLEEYYRNAREDLVYAIDNATTDGERGALESDVVALDRWYDGVVNGMIPFHG